MGLNALSVSLSVPGSTFTAAAFMGKDQGSFYNPSVARLASEKMRLILIDEIRHHASTGAPTSQLSEDEILSLAEVMSGPDNWSTRGE